MTRDDITDEEYTTWKDHVITGIKIVVVIVIAIGIWFILYPFT